MVESKAMDMSQLISESNILYTNSLIANRQQVYAPGDQIEVWIPSGKYIANLAKYRLFYRIVHKTNVQNACLLINSPSSMFQVQSIRADQKDLCPSQSDRSRPIFNAFKARLSDKDSDQDDPLTYHNEYREFQYTPSDTANRHLNTAAAAGRLETAFSDLDPTSKTYKQVYRDRLQLLQRFGHFDANTNSQFTYDQLVDPNSSAVTLGADEKYSWFSVSLGELCIELQTMNQVYMGQFNDGIRIQLRLIEPRYCMSLVIPRKQKYTEGTNDDTEFVWTNSMSYRLTDVFMSQRQHHLLPEGEQIMAQLSQKLPIPYVTYQYIQTPLLGQSTLINSTTLQSDNYLGSVILFTGTGQTVDQPLNQVVNYQGNTIHNEPQVMYDQDHFWLQYLRAQVEVDNVLYKQNSPPISSRHLINYLTSIDGVDTLFQGKQLNVSFQEFIDRASSIIIPANTLGSQGISVKGKRLTLTIEFQTPQTKDIANYQCHIFHLVTASMRVDSQAGVLVE